MNRAMTCPSQGATVFVWPARCNNCVGTCELAYLSKILKTITFNNNNFIENLEHKREFVEMTTTKMRFLTFKHWPSETFALHRMAEDGFYYCGVKDEVKCVNCAAILSDWRFDQKGFRPHTIVNDTHSQCQPPRKITWSADPERCKQEQTFIARHFDGNRDVNMAELDNRMKSLVPLLGEGVKAHKFAMAGFYHLGFSDCTRCYLCDAELNQWLILDCPYKEHQRWSNQCPLVQHNKQTHLHACYGGLTETG
nr:ORF3 [Acipenserid herpesvirus 1]